jgi:hypothetical protein
MTKQTLILILVSCVGIGGFSAGMRAGVDHLSAQHEVQTWEQIGKKLAK